MEYVMWENDSMLYKKWSMTNNGLQLILNMR